MTREQAEKLQDILNRRVADRIACRITGQMINMGLISEMHRLLDQIYPSWILINLRSQVAAEHLLEQHYSGNKP